jgi:ribonuclease HI
MSTSLTIGTDGSCLKNPGGPSGWAWVTEHGDYQYGSIPSGTNQVAELEALLRALREHITVEDLTSTRSGSGAGSRRGGGRRPAAR